MSFYCPRCETKALVIEVRRLATGGRRRRLECQNPDCAHRWTIREESSEPLPPGFTAPRKRPRRSTPNRLTDDELLLILERRDLSTGQLSKLLGRTREFFRQVRSGMIYIDQLPHIPRWNSKEQQVTCADCSQWLGYCTLGFPDPETEGIGFANECVSFLPQKEAGAQEGIC
jgi:hypothetical protein